MRSAPGSTPSRLVRLSLGALCTGALALFAFGCGSGGGGNSTASSSGGGNGIKGKRFTMMVQSTPVTGKVVEEHAIELLKKQGVNASIKFNPSTPNVAISQLLGGNIDVYAEAVSGGVSAALQGIPLVDFALLQPRTDYVFMARPGINSLSDLKGKKVGVADTTGVTYSLAGIALNAGGLTTKDVHIVAVGGQSDRQAAFIAGRVDATMLGHAAQIALAGRGYKVLYDYTKQSPDLYDDNAFATKKWLQSNKALAVAFNKAILESFKWFNDPANANAVVQEAVKNTPGADAKQTAELFDDLRKANAYPDGTVLDQTVLDKQQKSFKAAGGIEDTVPIGQWSDPSYGRQAKAAVG